jgi:hypothetical protein
MTKQTESEAQASQKTNSDKKQKTIVKINKADVS